MASKLRKYTDARLERGEKKLTVWLDGADRDRIDQIKRAHGLSNQGDVIKRLLRQFERGEVANDGDLTDQTRNQDKPTG